MTNLHHKNSQVILFVALTYFVAWGCWFSTSIGFVQKGGVYVKIHTFQHGISGPNLFVLLGNLSPGLAALLITSLSSGKNGLIDLFSRLIRLRLGIGPYAFACIIPLAYSYLSWGILSVLGRQGAPSVSPWEEFIYLCLTLPFAPLWEELGWRGFLLPKLAETSSSLRSALVVGLVWGPWHAPLLLMAPRAGMAFLDAMIMFCVLIVGLSLLFVWTFNWSKGALLPVILFHGVHNAVTSYLLDPSMSVGAWTPVLVLTFFIWLTVGIVGVTLRVFRSRTGKTILTGETRKEAS